MSILVLSLLNLSMLNLAKAETSVIKVSFGYVYKIRCEGRLLLSSIGDDRLLQLAALPQEIGCGVILKPLRASGTTNLLLETSTGSSLTKIVISPGGSSPINSEIDIKASRTE